MPASNNNYNTPANPKTFLKTLNFLYLAILVGLVMFTGVAYFLVSSEGGLSPDVSDVFGMVVPLVAIALAAGGYFMYGVLLKAAKKDASLPEKLTAFRNASLVRYAMWDGAGLFSTIGFMLTGEMTYLVYVFVVLGLFILLPPTKTRTVSDLNLSSEEERELG